MTASALSSPGLNYVRPLVSSVSGQLRRIASRFGDPEVADIRRGHLLESFRLYLSRVVLGLLSLGGIYIMPGIFKRAAEAQAHHGSLLIYGLELAAVGALQLLPSWQPLIDSAFEIIESDFTEQVQGKLATRYVDLFQSGIEPAISSPALYANAVHFAFTNRAFNIQLAAWVTTSVTAAYLLFRTSPRVAVVAMLVTPFIGVLTYFFGKTLRELNDRLCCENGKILSLHERLLSYPQMLFATINFLTPWTLSRLITDHGKMGALRRQRARANAYYGVIKEHATALLPTIILLLSLWFYARGQVVNFFHLGAVLGLVGGLRTGVVNIFDLLKARAEKRGATRELRSLLATSAAITTHDTALANPTTNREIEIKNVTFSRGRLVLFDHLNLVIPAGTLCLIKGESGVGKTSLLRLMAGNLQPDHPAQATIRVGGNPAGTPGVHATFLIQEEVLLPGFSVSQNFSRHGDFPEAAVLEALRLADAGFVGPQGLAKMVEEYSGGERKRIAIAMALVSHPRLLLLDEPFSGLDEGAMERVSETFNAMRDKGTTLLLISHQFPPALRPDSTYRLERGQLTLEAEIHALLKVQHRTPYARKSAVPRGSRPARLRVRESA